MAAKNPNFNALLGEAQERAITVHNSAIGDFLSVFNEYLVEKNTYIDRSEQIQVMQRLAEGISSVGRGHIAFDALASGSLVQENSAPTALSAKKPETPAQQVPTPYSKDIEDKLIEIASMLGLNGQLPLNEDQTLKTENLRPLFREAINKLANSKPVDDARVTALEEERDEAKSELAKVKAELKKLKEDADSNRVGRSADDAAEMKETGDTIFTLLNKKAKSVKVGTDDVKLLLKEIEYRTIARGVDLMRDSGNEVEHKLVGPKQQDTSTTSQ